MVSVLASSAVDRGFEPGSVQTKDYEIGICCFSYLQFSNISAISWREQDNFQRDDDDIRFVLDQQTEVDFYNASSLKQ